MTFDTPIQAVVSFAALAVWSWWVVSPPAKPRWPFVVVWFVTLLLAVSSLTYLDALPKGAPSAFNFAARLFLLIVGIGVPLVAYARHRREHAT